MTRLTAEQVSAFERDGYLLIPNVFSAAEIDAMRAAIFRLNGNPRLVFSARDATKFRGSLFNYRDLQAIPFDDRLLDIIRSVLGDGFVYFGDSSVQMGQGPRGLHRDNIHRFNPVGPDWVGDYPLIRMGIYIGDFETQSGGLKLVPRSHRPLVPFLSPKNLLRLSRATRVLTPPFRWGRNLMAVFQGGENVPSHSGDVLIWSFRLLHSGNAVKLKRFPHWALPVWLERRAPDAWRRPGNQDRMVMFCAYAKPGDHLRRYLTARRPGDLEQWRQTRWNESFEALARAKHVPLWKPDSEMGAKYAGTEPEESGPV